MIMKPISATKKGVLISVALIASSLITFYLLKMSERGESQYITLSIFIAGMVWVLYTFKQKNPGSSFKSFFNEGFKSFIVVTFIMVLYTFVFYKLNPQILDNAILENNAIIQSDGNRTAMEIAENTKKIRNIFMPMMLSINTIKYLILGSLISVVCGGFFSQKN